tara:strand:+ start:770 stop:1081 length:312 start_codon:yes stop_codon:yes gene_type:complete
MREQARTQSPSVVAVRQGLGLPVRTAVTLAESELHLLVVAGLVLATRRATWMAALVVQAVAAVKQRMVVQETQAVSPLSRGTQAAMVKGAEPIMPVAVAEPPP